MWVRLATIAAILGLAGPAGQDGSRLALIQQRGFLGCGVEPNVPGFAEIDAQSRYRGLDVDICRALSAAIFGTADKVKYISASSVSAFQAGNEIDVVSRRITWELQREGRFGLLFGPIVFYDGQGFLVSRKLGVTDPRRLAGAEICVAGSTVFESNLNSYFAAEKLRLNKILLADPHNLKDIAAALSSGRCHVYTSDVSLLGGVRSLLPRPADFAILAEQISREPLAQLVRSEDVPFFNLLRWTIFALINAEELGVTSKNADDMRKSPNADVQRLLGVVPGNGKALGLSEDWAYNAIRIVGNYGEIFEKNVGRDSPLGLDRGLNRLSTKGGLMYAPPLR
jgi:general L-amino acid transport system substrate-binding protein